MSGVAAEMDIDEIHRLTAEEYHQLIESGGLHEDTRVELIDGLIVDMSPKTPAHERAIGWILDCFFAQVDVARYAIRAGVPLSLGNSEPEPDLLILDREVPQPHHPATAELVVEVALSSRRRDLRVKPRLYAGAGVPVYWVIDLDGGRAIQHSEPVGGEYQRVEVVTELTAPHLGLAPVAVAEVLAAIAR